MSNPTRHKTAPTADGIDHGLCVFTDCLNAVVEKYEDGYMLCTILWSGGSCEEYYQMFEEQQEKEENMDKKTGRNGAEDRRPGLRAPEATD